MYAVYVLQTKSCRCDSDCNVQKDANLSEVAWDMTQRNRFITWQKRRRSRGTLSCFRSWSGRFRCRRQLVAINVSHDRETKKKKNKKTHWSWSERSRPRMRLNAINWWKSSSSSRRRRLTESGSWSGRSRPSMRLVSKHQHRATLRSV